MVVAVNRRAFLLAPFALTSRAKAGFHITGKLDATELESQEGYFSLGNELAIVTRPNSPIHDDLKAMRGTEVQCSVFNP